MSCGTGKTQRRGKTMPKPPDPGPGERVTEVIPCAGTPYRCEGFDPDDWPPGEVPDFSLFREWERS